MTSAGEHRDHQPLHSHQGTREALTIQEHSAKAVDAGTKYRRGLVALVAVMALAIVATLVIVSVTALQGPGRSRHTQELVTQAQAAVKSLRGEISGLDREIARLQQLDESLKGYISTEDERIRLYILDLFRALRAGSQSLVLPTQPPATRPSSSTSGAEGQSSGATRARPTPSAGTTTPRPTPTPTATLTPTPTPHPSGGLLPSICVSIGRLHVGC